MKAAAKEAFGDDSLQGKTVAVQGVGNVAYSLCRYLHDEGAKLVVTDINKDNMERAVRDFGAETVAPDAIYDVDCDIFSPCALGAVINDDTIQRLKCKVVAGSANNQLKTDEHGDILTEKGIVYAPDYVINSGGVINVADELLGYNRERAMKKWRVSIRRSAGCSKSPNGTAFPATKLRIAWLRNGLRPCVDPAARFCKTSGRS